MWTLGDLMKQGLSLWCRCRDCGKVRFRSPGSISVPFTTAARDVGKLMKCATCGSCNIETAAGGPLEPVARSRGEDEGDAETGFGALLFEPRGAQKGDADVEDVFD